MFGVFAAASNAFKTPTIPKNLTVDSECMPEFGVWDALERVVVEDVVI